MLAMSLHDAQAERRQLLGRVATLQHRLREEVLTDGEARLERKDDRKDKRLPEDDAKENREALTELIAQIDRIVESSEHPTESLAGEVCARSCIRRIRA